MEHPLHNIDNLMHVAWCLFTMEQVSNSACHLYLDSLRIYFFKVCKYGGCLWWGLGASGMKNVAGQSDLCPGSVFPGDTAGCPGISGRLEGTLATMNV